MLYPFMDTHLTDEPFLLQFFFLCFYPSRKKSKAFLMSSSKAVWLMRMSPIPAKSVKLIVVPVFFLSWCMSSMS